MRKQAKAIVESLINNFGFEKTAIYNEYGASYEITKVSVILKTPTEPYTTKLIKNMCPEEVEALKLAMTLVKFYNLYDLRKKNAQLRTVVANQLFMCEGKLYVMDRERQRKNDSFLCHRMDNGDMVYISYDTVVTKWVKVYELEMDEDEIQTLQSNNDQCSCEYHSDFIDVWGCVK